MSWLFLPVGWRCIPARVNPLLFSGGVREALFGDHNYHLIWKERRGFAKVAIEAKTVSEKFTSTQTNDDCRLGHHSHVHQELPRSCARHGIRSSYVLLLAKIESCVQQDNSLGFLSYVYEKTRLPLVPIYGMFPVKMM